MFDTLVRRVLSSAAHSETTESPDQTELLTDNDVLGPLQDLRAFFFTCMILKQTPSFVLGRFCRSTYEQEYASRPTLLRPRWIVCLSIMPLG